MLHKGASTQCHNQQVLAKPHHNPSNRDQQAREKLQQKANIRSQAHIQIGEETLKIIHMSCISKTACFSVNYASFSLQSGWNKEPKGSNWSHPSELINRTPPSKSDMAPFWCVKPQPIRGFPTIEPAMF